MDELKFIYIIIHQLRFYHFRYLTVTQVNYIYQRNLRSFGTKILLIWLASVIVSLAPLFGWKDADFLRIIKEEKRCRVSYKIFEYEQFRHLFNVLYNIFY